MAISLRERGDVPLPIKTIETQRLYQQVADQLRELIRSGELPRGSRLPPERDLARQLGVSRPVVREAMVVLEIARLVEVRMGSGIFVKASTQDAVRPFPLSDGGPSPFDLIAARKLLEPEIVQAAAASLTAEDLAAIEETLEQMREAIAAGRDIMAIDRLFHVRIAAATRNTVLAAIVDQLWEQTTAPIYSGLRRRTDRPEHHRTALMHHERVLEALRHRDASAGREAMRAHLAQTEATLMEADIAADADGHLADEGT